MHGVNNKKMCSEYFEPNNEALKISPPSFRLRFSFLLAFGRLQSFTLWLRVLMLYGVYFFGVLNRSINAQLHGPIVVG